MVKAIANTAEAIADFFIISKFAPAVFVIGTMAFFGFALPAIVMAVSWIAL